MIRLITGALALALLVFCGICMLSSKKYASRLERVSEKDFPLKRYMAIGLTVQKALFRVTNNNRALIGSLEVRRKLAIVYGEHQLKFYCMIYSADALTYIVILLLLGLVLAAMGNMIEPLLLTLGLAVVIVLMVLPKRLDEYIANRQQAIRLEFPDFLSKYILLVGAGMNAVEAWNTAGQVEDMNTPFYREVAITNHEIQTLGKAPADALRSFAARMRDSAISHFVASVVQNIEYGGDLAGVLLDQSNEAWKSRKQEALRLGETAGSKLSMIMMLMLVGIMVLVMAPAMMSMDIFG